MKIETQVGLFILAAIGIFFYLSFNIGSLELDGSSHHIYKVYFQDTGGLETRSLVKIAGVNVGAVKSISLMDNSLAEIIIKVKREHKLFRNSYAIISNEGLISAKTLEIDPGDSSSGILPPGSTLAMPGKASTTVADIIESFKEISNSVQDVVSAFQGVFATPEGEKMISSALTHAEKASTRLANFSLHLDDILKGNKTFINNTCSDISQASEKINHLVSTINNKTTEITTNITDASSNLKASGQNLNQTLENTKSITENVVEGKGTIGKLLTDETLFYDIKNTVSDVKNMVGKANELCINIELGTASYLMTDNKRGSAEIQISTESDYFYSIQVSSDSIGKITRKTTYSEYYDAQNNLIDTTLPTFSEYEKARVPAKRIDIFQSQGEPLFGFLFCKKFDSLTLKIGIIESTFGASAEYDFSLKFNNFRWITKLEAFDFDSFNNTKFKSTPKDKKSRIHLRWSNKIFLLKNMYTAIGWDDMLSQHRNDSLFWGAGIQFGDDDIKYLLSMLPFGKIMGS